MTERIKKINRALLELELGILFLGVLISLGWLLIFRQFYDFVSIWIGNVLALLGAYHMYRTLDRALDCGDQAPRMVVAGYFLRCTVLFVIMVLEVRTEVLNVLLTFLGVMMLKCGSYIQPWTHRFCNYMFHETDPVPMPMPEEGAEAAESVQSKDAETAQTETAEKG